MLALGSMGLTVLVSVNGCINDIKTSNFERYFLVSFPK